MPQRACEGEADDVALSTGPQGLGACFPRRLVQTLKLKRNRGKRPPANGLFSLSKTCAVTISRVYKRSSSIRS
jgi:hypothetical protein